MVSSITRFLISISVVIVAVSVEGAQRTFVSAATGSDSNGCTRPAPCRNFAAAMALTDVNGEVVALDSGGYGATTITTSVSLVAPPGVHAAISGFTGNALTIDAPGSTVILRGLSLDSKGSVFGLVATDVFTLMVDRCSFAGFGFAISVTLDTDGSQIFIDDSFVRKSTNAVRFMTTVGTVRASLRNVIVDKSNAGTAIIASTNSRVVAEGCRANGHFIGFAPVDNGSMILEHCMGSNNSIGIRAAGTATAFVSNSTFAENSSFGVQAIESGTIRIATSTITANGTGVGVNNSGAVLTRGDNSLEANTVDGTFTGTFTTK